MKIEKFDNHFIVYLKKEDMKNIDFENTISLENYFRKLFLKLKKFFKQEVNGYYHLDMYIDEYYGAVIDIFKYDFEYGNYDKIEMEINIINSIFLYEIDDYSIIDKKLFDIYIYNGKIYGKLKQKPNVKKELFILEMTKIIYKSEEILNEGIKIMI